MMATTGLEAWLIDIELSLSSQYDTSIVNAFVTYLQQESFDDDLSAVIEDIKNEDDSYIVEYMQTIFNESDDYTPETTRFVQCLKHIISKRNTYRSKINVDERHSDTSSHSINTIIPNTITTTTLHSRFTMYSTQTNQIATAASRSGFGEKTNQRNIARSMRKSESMSDVSLDLDQEMLTSVLNEVDDFKSDGEHVTQSQDKPEYIQNDNHNHQSTSKEIYSFTKLHPKQTDIWYELFFHPSIFNHFFCAWYFRLFHENSC